MAPIYFPNLPPSFPRNLHLAVEGLIRPGTRAAQGVSQTDMEKRAKLEKWKRNVLKDLSMFISPNRLCVR